MSIQMGNDILMGGSGNDFIMGDVFSYSSIASSPSNAMFLTCGEDILIGGSGNDVLVGDIYNKGNYSDSRVVAGADTFIFDINEVGGFGDDQILDLSFHININTDVKDTLKFLNVLDLDGLNGVTLDDFILMATLESIGISTLMCVYSDDTHSQQVGTIYLNNVPYTNFTALSDYANFAFG